MSRKHFSNTRSNLAATVKTSQRRSRTIKHFFLLLLFLVLPPLLLLLLLPFLLLHLLFFFFVGARGCRGVGWQVWNRGWGSEGGVGVRGSWGCNAGKIYRRYFPSQGLLQIVTSCAALEPNTLPSRPSLSSGTEGEGSGRQPPSPRQDVRALLPQESLLFLSKRVDSKFSESTVNCSEGTKADELISVVLSVT